MNILLVSSYLPYPLFSGGHIRLYNLIKILSKKHDITLICEKRDYQGDAEMRELKKFCKKVITVNRKKQWTIGNILKTGLSLSPFLITGHTSMQMKKEIQRGLNENQFDLIHVETSYVMQNIPRTSLPIVLVEHNIEYLVYKRFADTAPTFIRPLLYYDIAKLKLAEEKAWKKATKLVAVSEQEKKLMKREDAVVVPNGVDLDRFRIKNHESRIMNQEKIILFIGDFKWIENKDAAKWIVTEIWPKIHNSKFMIHNSIKLWIVGRKIPQNIKDMGGESVILDEDAPIDTSLIYQKADVLLAPIRVGGGTSFKILEAMASGVPVITTPLGNAIDAKENSEILIANTSQDFVQNIKKLLEDKKFYEKIATNARRLIEEKYNWEKIAQDLNSVYESVTQ